MASVDLDNHLFLGRDRSQWKWRARSNKKPYTIESSSDDVAWRFVVATWDFTGGAGSGVLRLYLDGEEVPESPLTNASAPVGVPSTIALGPGEDNSMTISHAAYDRFSIWDEAMSAEEVAGLYTKGRHCAAVSSDCSGTQLLQASWDEQFDADAAQGSGAATLHGAPDQYCRLDCRSRYQGRRFKYRIGMPSHDGGDNDRVPVHAVLPPCQNGTVSVSNTENYGGVSVQADGELRPVGISLAPWMPAPESPMTLRVGLHVDRVDVPNGAPVAVGAQNYVTGRIAELQTGAGSTESTVVASELTQPDGYWENAELHVMTGALRGQQVRVASSSQADRSLTIDGQFGETPTVGDRMTVIEPWRVEPAGLHGELYRLECDLEERHKGVDRFAVLETAVIGAEGYTRYNSGRIQYYPRALKAGDIFFGKREDGSTYDHWAYTVFIDRVEMDGPMTYECTTRADDAFMVRDPESGESIKVARAENLQWETRRPEQHPDPTAVQEAMWAPGTWRHTVRNCPRTMGYDARDDRLTAVVVGVDAGGVERAGYIRGRWNESAGLVEWEDDPDPRNPFLLLDDLRAVLGGESSITGTLGAIGDAYEVHEGNWALPFTATIGNPDGMVACAMEGAPDRYSFDPRRHFDETTNPLTLTMSGDDKVGSEGGMGLFSNRDCEILFVENPWARRSSDRFWGYGRAKTINQHGFQSFYDPGRPLTCAVTGDFRNVRHVPWSNQAVAPAFGNYHWPHPQWYHPSTVGLVVDDGMATTSHVHLYVSEDGVHLERLGVVVERNTPPYDAARVMPVSVAPRLGTRRLYWYRGGSSPAEFNMATIRLGGEALYRLANDAVGGELETCKLLREGDRWEDLRLNADPKGGIVTVAVLNAETRATAPGYDHDDCCPIVDGVESRITWNGAGLGEVTDESVVLEFRLRRTTSGAASPELYAWMVGRLLGGSKPEAAGARVEGQINPAAVANAKPKLAWTYVDHRDYSQSAYQVLVSSTQEKLKVNEGDLWDSGVVLSEEPVAQYAGEQLGSAWTYFWKVRVRNSEGVWSEEW